MKVTIYGIGMLCICLTGILGLNSVEMYFAGGVTVWLAILLFLLHVTIIIIYVVQEVEAEQAAKKK